MKRVIALALVCLIFAGCSAQPEATTAATTAPTTAATEAPKQEITVNSEGIYEIDGVLFSKLYPLDEASLTKLAEKINAIQRDYLPEGSKVFVSLIPDKSYFSDYEEKIDHYEMAQLLESGLENAEYIEIADTLTLEDFYKTDGHWRQENLIDTANKLGESLGFALDKADFEEKTALDDYKGMYAPIYDGEVQGEAMYYLTNGHIENAVVDNFQKKDFTQVYDTAMLDSETPYDMFLSGPTPLEVITNPDAETERELVIFRDSFSSSLVPLMLNEYSKITLIDLRYMASQLMPQMVDFGNADVLFLYSAAVANKSVMLK